jgi:anti-sigma B factor antagonist
MDDPAGTPVSRLADGTVVVAPLGEVVFPTIGPVRQAIVGAVAQATPPSIVIVDLAGVTLMDSSGLSALVAGLKAASATGVDYGVRNANASILTQLTLTGLAGILNHSGSALPAPPTAPATVPADHET